LISDLLTVGFPSNFEGRFATPESNFWPFRSSK
jgi:hypothetical protein